MGSQLGNLIARSITTTLPRKLHRQLDLTKLLSYQPKYYNVHLIYTLIDFYPNYMNLTIQAVIGLYQSLFSMSMCYFHMCNSLRQRPLQLDCNFIQLFNRRFTLLVAPIDEDLSLQKIECAERHAAIRIIKALIGFNISGAGTLIRRTGIEWNVFLYRLLVPTEDVA